jgi:hypothetical protein
VSGTAWREDVDRLRALFEAGHSDVEIGEVLGRSARAVSNKRVEQGMLRNKRNPCTPGMEARIKFLDEAGRGPEEIAGLVDRSERYVRAVMRRLGLVPARVGARTWRGGRVGIVELSDRQLINELVLRGYRVSRPSAKVEVEETPATLLW